MENESFTLGSVSLEDYIIRPKQIDGGKRKEIETKVAELEKAHMDVEEIPLRLLKIDLNEYPLISPKFLSMGNKIEYKGDRIQVPKSAVYKRTARGFSSFEIGFKKNLTIQIPMVEVISPNIDYKFLDELAKSFEFAEHTSVSRINRSYYHSDTFSFGWVPRQVARKYKHLIKENKTLETSFVGIIPTETKKRLEEAEKIFGRNNIYLVAEARESDWKGKKEMNDAWLLGISGDNSKCYLVDHFGKTYG